MAQSLPLSLDDPWPTQTVPSRSSRSEITDRPASSENWVSLPSFHLASPLLVPIQRLPSRPASSVAIRLLGRYSPAGGCHARAPTPWRRNNPNSVPSHRYPSGVCAIASIAPLVKPSRTLHAVCAY